MVNLKASGALCALSLTASAASFPPKPEGITVVNSEKFPGVSISFKETSICETTDGVKGYSGYVNLPPNSAENRTYESHIYFWFFEAREDPENAPLALWLQGGPGVPSTPAAVGENGPCIVIEDSKTTELNPWSWNDKTNLIYIDQPVQVGYSYDSLVNGTLDVVPTPFNYTPSDFSDGVPETNLTFLTGTFASKNMTHAPRTTVGAAPTIWQFFQVWMQEFPEFKSKDNRLSIWGESYGGHYGPIYADYFEQQNDRIASGEDTTEAVEIHLDTVGFINPCIDIDTQMIYYAEYAVNNTYDVQLMTDEQYKSAVAASPTCKNMTAACRSLAAEKDPQGLGNQPDVNKACSDAFKYCFKNMYSAFEQSGRNKFDILAPVLPEAFPPVWAAGYLNDAETQQALGVPLNWTGQSLPVAVGFDQTGDFILGNGLEKLGSLIDRGVKVALFYGDRDFQCNWLGGEAISLAIESKLSDDFKKAGYEEIQTNDSYVGGYVRQHGNLSFARIFQAGHEAPYYQPETSLEMFNRVMFNTDVATGKVSSEGYSSKGLDSAWTSCDTIPEEGHAQCYLWDVLETCTEPEKAVLLSGNAVVRDFILVGQTGGNGTNGTAL